jgi:hypothetical protein
MRFLIAFIASAVFVARGYRELSKRRTALAPRERAPKHPSVFNGAFRVSVYLNPL